MKESSLWAWNVSALFYKKTYGPLAHQIDEDMFSYLGKDIKGATVIDCGCGPGIVSRKFIKKGATRVFAIDVNPYMIHQMDLVYQIQPIEAKIDENTFAELSIKEGVDVILFKRSLYQDSIEASNILKSAYNVLKPGGAIVLIHPEASLRFYAFGKPFRVRRHTPYHLFNRFVSRLGVAFGIEEYAVYTRKKLIQLAEKASLEAKVEIIPTKQRAFNLLAIRRPMVSNIRR